MGDRISDAIIYASIFALAFYAFSWLTRWLYRGERAAAEANRKASLATGNANTKAVEDNTAAIRELIRKLDEDKR